MKINYADYKDVAPQLIAEHESFEICGVDIEDMFDISGELEKIIEKQYLKCRIYTKNRVVTGLAGLLNPAWGILSLATIAAHNIVTLSPDYEIARDLANNRIEVVWKN
ncbi:hypothetical protein [Otariodibacter sp.]|uniref:hypothetical protein n=1 Tax=Otariodibacter sp. TaxID=3030919 RepID=UPI00263998EF|nr:hypothetical protein [Otariodibacter sp.]